MPVLLEERVVTLEFADLHARNVVQRPAKPPARSKGIHQSGILVAIARKVGWLEAGEKDESEMPIIMALGFAWEEFVFSLFPDIDWQPGEVERDGIFMSADGIGVYEPTGEPMVEEGKFTLKSIAEGEEFIKSPKWRMWQHQGREYCYGYGPRVERWHVCHARGNYKDVFWPTYKQYVVRFSDMECEQTHGMLVKNKHLAVAE